jgi:hypothetical protein
MKATIQHAPVMPMLSRGKLWNRELTPKDHQARTCVNLCDQVSIPAIFLQNAAVSHSETNSGKGLAERLALAIPQ